MRSWVAPLAAVAASFVVCFAGLGAARTEHGSWVPVTAEGSAPVPGAGIGNWVLLAVTERASVSALLGDPAPARTDGFATGHNGWDEAQHWAVEAATSELRRLGVEPVVPDTPKLSGH